MVDLVEDQRLVVWWWWWDRLEVWDWIRVGLQHWEISALRTNAQHSRKGAEGTPTVGGVSIDNFVHRLLRQDIYDFNPAEVQFV
jgi:hypothetical protein